MQINKPNSLFYNWLFAAVVLIATEIMTKTGMARAVVFNLIHDENIDSNALGGFQEAADIWSGHLTDSIVVNLNIGFESLDAGILGQTSTESLTYTYSQVENALIEDSTSIDDTTATTRLPGLGRVRTVSGFSEYFDFVGTEEDGSLEITDVTQGGISADNVFLSLNRANAKALNLIGGNDIADDASITFSSNFDFDFERSDGIDSDKFDFVGVAAHEIGHALGFTSGVDTVDVTADVDPNTGQAPPFSGTDLDGSAIFDVMDLFRHSDLSVAVSDALGQEVLDLSVGDEPVTYNGITYDGEPYLSIDGGDTILSEGELEAVLATGTFNGDGRQTSHWKDGQGLGLFDPTLSRGELGVISDVDLRALDVIGYNSTTASIPFDFSPSLGIFLVIGLYGLKRLKSRLK